MIANSNPSLYTRDEEGKEERNKFYHRFTPHIGKSNIGALFESLTITPSSSLQVVYKQSDTHHDSVYCSTGVPKTIVTTKVLFSEFATKFGSSKTDTREQNDYCANASDTSKQYY